MLYASKNSSLKVTAINADFAELMARSMSCSKTRAFAVGLGESMCAGANAITVALPFPAHPPQAILSLRATMGGI